MADTSSWVIQRAASSLLGTVVGGLVGYWTSKKMHERTAAVDEVRSRNTMLREGAMAFIAGIEKLDVGPAALERVSQRWGPAAARVLSPETDDRESASSTPRWPCS